MQYPRRRPIASLLAGLSPAGMAASFAARSFSTDSARLRDVGYAPNNVT
jgi:hypothetical protein